MCRDNTIWGLKSPLFLFILGLRASVTHELMSRTKRPYGKILLRLTRKSCAPLQVRGYYAAP